MQTRLRFWLRESPAAALAAMLFFLAPQGASAGDIHKGIVEFSAETVQRIPTRKPVQGKLYVSKKKVRIETDSEDRKKIILFDSLDKKTVHMNPARKEYMEIPWPKNKSSQPRLGARQPLPGDPNHPCAKFAQLKCKRLAQNETIGDRKTEKWEIVRVIQTNDQGSRTMRFLVWVDRKLGVNVREERFIDGKPKGSSELRAIKEGAQPETLFQVPADYRRIEAPTPTPRPGEPADGNK